MPSPTCAACGYSLTGLRPSPTGPVVCPECALAQNPLAGGARRPSNSYLASFVASIVVQAACMECSHLLSSPQGGAVRLAVAMLVFSPMVGIMAGLASGYVATRKHHVGTRGRRGRLWRMLLVNFVFNGLVWLALLAIGSAMFTTGGTAD